MGRDISYLNNATSCVNRLEEYSQRDIHQYLGILATLWHPINPKRIFGLEIRSRVLVSRKHSIRVSLDKSQG